MPNAIVLEIGRLKRQNGAIILAHSYQSGPVQDIADFVGDSLELSRIARRESADLVVFCGVRFMAETAKLLSPGSTVVLPAADAGCSLAASMSEDDLGRMQEEHPEACSVVYVNSSLELKAASWSCCTSANALQVAEAAPSDSIIFGPDRNLGSWVASRTTKKVHIWPGGCHAHSGADIRDLHEKVHSWPDAEVLVHPECSPLFWREARSVLGTGGMIRHVAESQAKRFIIVTEKGMIHRLQTLFPEREFVAAGNIFCGDMALTTPEMVLGALEHPSDEIHVPKHLAAAAALAVERMTEVG
jgi:quinolinate synthase